MSFFGSYQSSTELGCKQNGQPVSSSRTARAFVLILSGAPGTTATLLFVVLALATVTLGRYAAPDAKTVVELDGAENIGALVTRQFCQN